MTGYNPSTKKGFLMHLGGENVEYLDRCLLESSSRHENMLIQRIIASLINNDSNKKGLQFTLTGGDSLSLAYWQSYLDIFGFKNQIKLYGNPTWKEDFSLIRGSVRFNAHNGEVTHPVNVKGMIRLPKMPPSDIKKRLKTHRNRPMA